MITWLTEDSVNCNKMMFLKEDKESSGEVVIFFHGASSQTMSNRQKTLQARDHINNDARLCRSHSPGAWVPKGITKDFKHSVVYQEGERHATV